MLGQQRESFINRVKSDIRTKNRGSIPTNQTVFFPPYKQANHIGHSLALQLPSDRNTKGLFSSKAWHESHVCVRERMRAIVCLGMFLYRGGDRVFPKEQEYLTVWSPWMLPNTKTAALCLKKMSQNVFYQFLRLDLWNVQTSMFISCILDTGNVLCRTCV